MRAVRNVLANVQRQHFIHARVFPRPRPREVNLLVTVWRVVWPTNPRIGYVYAGEPGYNPVPATQIQFHPSRLSCAAYEFITAVIRAIFRRRFRLRMDSPTMMANPTTQTAPRLIAIVIMIAPV
jgi:hypothetical protein